MSNTERWKQTPRPGTPSAPPRRYFASVIFTACASPSAVTNRTR